MSLRNFERIVSRADMNCKAGAKSQKFGRFAPALQVGLINPERSNPSHLTGRAADDERRKGEAWVQTMHVASNQKVVRPGWQPPPKGCFATAVSSEKHGQNVARRCV